MWIRANKLFRYIDSEIKHAENNLADIKDAKDEEAKSFNRGQRLFALKMRQKIESGDYMYITPWDRFKKWLPFWAVVITMWTTPKYTLQGYLWLTGKISESRLELLFANAIWIAIGIFIFATAIYCYIKKQGFAKITLYVFGLMVSLGCVVQEYLLPSERVHLGIFVIFGYWLFALLWQKTDYIIRFSLTIWTMLFILTTKELIENAMATRTGSIGDVGVDMFAVFVGMKIREMWEHVNG